MTCICVLGMHRSGTSCLTGMMQNMGVELGEVFTENLHNRKGNRENGRIVALNDDLLQYNGGAWHRPLVVNRWTRAHVRERDAIIDTLSGRGSAFWGFKDTRTAFTLPFWLEAIKEPRFIGTFRHPHRVAMSLHHRDKSPLDWGWNLWYQYNQRLLELARRHQFQLTDFDQDDAAYVEDALIKLAALGLRPAHAPHGRDFFDPALRNQTGSTVDGVKLPDNISALYAELKQYAVSKNQ